MLAPFLRSSTLCARSILYGFSFCVFFVRSRWSRSSWQDAYSIHRCSGSDLGVRGSVTCVDTSLHRVCTILVSTTSSFCVYVHAGHSAPLQRLLRGPYGFSFLCLLCVLAPSSWSSARAFFVVHMDSLFLYLLRVLATSSWSSTSYLHSTLYGFPFLLKLSMLFFYPMSAHSLHKISHDITFAIVFLFLFTCPLWSMHAHSCLL